MQKLDSLSIAPESVVIRPAKGGLALDTSFYAVQNNALIWHRLPADSVRVSYRVLPYDLQRQLSRLDTTQMGRDTIGRGIGLVYNPYERDNPLIDFKGLDYNGSFARGISFGNNQDLVLNSSFNLQLAGNLGDGVEVLAAITDENIPLQAEGNTQQLREFDKIFIQIKKGNNRLIAGDYELQRPNSYFVNYFKKLQGATFSTRQKLGNGFLNTNASVAIARGQFARNQLAQQEGNQGPYRLQGSQGERFIIVLSGTERIWLDGNLLRRGFEEDYVIDYNRGEVTFTSRRLITKDSRIVVEFEYTDQSYLRSLYAFNLDYQQQKLRVYLNAFNQQDSRTSTGDQRLTEQQQQVLREAGDNLGRAVVPAIDTVSSASTATRATYALRTALINCGGRDTAILFLAYTTQPDSGRYVARFSLVGPNRGDYVLDTEQAANERVYRWVPPDPNTCQSRGEYAPIVQLTAPQQQQLFAAGAEYKAGKAAIKAEVALSRNDRNRFSTLDAGDDIGLAAYTSLSRIFNFGADSSGWSLATLGAYEAVQANFQALNPYRDQEFLRDWNLANVQGVGTIDRAFEHLGRAEFTLRRNGWGQTGYALSVFLRDSLYSGLRHAVQWQFNRNNWLVEGQSSWLNTAEIGRNTRFTRPKVLVAKTLPQWKGWRIGANAERERSERYAADTLQSSSFFYDRYGVFINNADTARLKWGANMAQRIDYLPQSNDFQRSARATEFNLNNQWERRRTIQGATLFSYRRLEVSDTSQNALQPGETFLGRLDVNLNAWRGALRANTTYEIGSGQEPKVEFSYVKVAQGSGTHVWLDSLYNNDGKIQLNEMEVAPFTDLAEYVRVSIYTTEFIRTNNVSLNQSFQLEPRAVWFKFKGLRKFLSRFSTQTSINLNRKTLQSQGIQPWNPLQLNIADTALVSLSASQRHTLFFDRSNPRFDMQGSYADNRSRAVQTTGYEARRLSEFALRARFNLSATMSITGTMSGGRRSTDSEFFNNKDFSLQFLKAEPQLTFLPSKNFRMIGAYVFQKDRNTLQENGEQALRHDLSLETTYNRSAQSQLRLRMSLVAVQFDGEAASPVGFAILNGLQPGRNWLWNLGLNRQLARNLTLSLSYEGRKTGESRVVHVGRAQVTAVF